MGEPVDHVYVMSSDGGWMVRVPGRIHATEHSDLWEAMKEAEEFAWIRRCAGGAPIAIRVRRPEGVWIEIDGEGVVTPLTSM